MPTYAYKGEGKSKIGKMLPTKFMKGPFMTWPCSPYEAVLQIIQMYNMLLCIKVSKYISVQNPLQKRAYVRTYVQYGSYFDKTF